MHGGDFSKFNETTTTTTTTTAAVYYTLPKAYLSLLFSLIRATRGRNLIFASPPAAAG